MKVIDLNVLLYAINTSAPQHEQVLGWWQETLSGDESVGLAWVVVNGFLRISTNPKIFPQPLSATTAIEKVDRWLQADTVSVITEKDDHWSVLRDLLRESGAAGNLTTDAHLAAMALTRGASLVSCDRDFARFAGLRLENPVAATG